MPTCDKVSRRARPEPIDAKMSRTPRRSLFLKLASLLGMVQLAAVAGVSGWLTYSEARGHRRELEHKAVLYAQLTAEQVKSAVAFDDKETAREIFDAVAQDGDVEGSDRVAPRYRRQRGGEGRCSGEEERRED